jgi:hypothetical protein
MKNSSMKNLIYLFIGIFLFSCQKENTDLGTEYQYIIGEWEGLTSDSGATVFASFKKNGKVVIETEAQRGVKVKLDRFGSKIDDFHNGQWYLYLQYLARDNESIGVSKKPGVTDTIYIGTVFTQSDTLKRDLVPLTRKK